MRLIRNLKRLKAPSPAVIAVGNFDGVHLGHQALLARLSEAAAAHKAAASVMVFEPQPSELFLKYNAPARLMHFAEKRAALKAYSVAQLICLPFEKVALTPAEEFVTEILRQQLNVVGIVAGEDFRFGRDGEGDTGLLRTLAQQQGFSLAVVPPVVRDGDIVSSSRIRKLLAGGEFEAAERLLGRPFTMGGRVVAGEQRGRTLGFPTANIAVDRLVSPLRGVFAARVYGTQPGRRDVQPRPGVVNLGYRPTVAGQSAASLWLEVHLLKFRRRLYGRTLRVSFVKKLRDECKFESLEALKTQIARDVEAARAVLSD